MEVTYHKLRNFLVEYKELNTQGVYRPVAVGKYGIRKRESIYSKELAKDYSKNKIIRKGTLTVGMGSRQIDIGILSDECVYCVSPAYHTYKISNINFDYLRYCLECRNADMFVRYVKRGTRQGKSIDLHRWLDYEIPVCSDYQQLQIVANLDKVTHTIDLCHAMLEKLDLLVKARFVEMFGDLKINPKKWNIVKFTDIATIDGNMTTDFEKYSDYPHIGIDSIEKDTGELKGFRTVSEDNIISGKYLFTPDHIIYSKIRPNLNKVALPCFYGLCSADAYTILPNAKNCNRIFLAYVMRSNYFLEYILQFCKRTNLPKVNRKEISGFTTPLPPIELQQQFADFAGQAENAKSAVKQVLAKAETLKQSLMQEYFQ